MHTYSHLPRRRPLVILILVSGVIYPGIINVFQTLVIAFGQHCATIMISYFVQYHVHYSAFPSVRASDSCAASRAPLRGKLAVLLMLLATARSLRYYPIPKVTEDLPGEKG